MPSTKPKQGMVALFFLIGRLRVCLWPRAKGIGCRLFAPRCAVPVLAAVALAVILLTAALPSGSIGATPAGAQEYKDPRTAPWPKLTDAETKAIQELMNKGTGSRQRQDAIDMLVGILVSKGWSTGTMGGGKPQYNSVLSLVEPNTLGTTERKLGGNVYIAERAFQSVSLLYSTVMHETVHSYQWQDPDRATALGRDGRELEAYQRELDNADRTGISEELRQELIAIVKEYRKPRPDGEAPDGGEPGDTIRPDPSFIEVPESATSPRPVTADSVTAMISVPPAGSLVRGSVPVFGLAYGDGFAEYRLEYGKGAEPKEWTAILSSTTPQQDASIPDNLSDFGGDTTLYGNLGNWDTGLKEYVYMPTYPPDHPVNLNGVYTLRLVVTGKDGALAEDRVTVEVGGVIPNAWGATVRSADGKVALTVPEQAIRDSFRVISVKPIDGPGAAIPPDSKLVGTIYQFREPAESFTKDTVLEMKYSLADLHGVTSDRLGIYAYDSVNGVWQHLPTQRKEAEQTLVTQIRGFPQGQAYFAILATESHLGSTIYEPPPASPEPQQAPDNGGVLTLDTFELDTGEWSSRDGDDGAAVSIDNALSLDGTRALRLTDVSGGGNFAVNARRTPFDAWEYPVVQFDYRVPPGVKTDLYVKVAGRWYNIQFADDLNVFDYKRVNIANIGRIRGVVADNRWHTAELNLAEMLATKTGNHLVTDMIFADWDVPGFMRLTAGHNRAGAAFFVDNFKIARGQSVPNLTNNRIEGGVLLIDDFESSDGLNVLGGEMQEFSTNGAGVDGGYTAGGARGSDHAYRVSFFGRIGDLFTYSGWATRLGGIDASAAKALSLDIKGLNGGEHPNIYFDDGTTRAYVDIENYVQLTGYWQRVSIPIRRFSEQGVDLTHLKELQVVFEWKPMEGTVFIDNVALEFGK